MVGALEHEKGNYFKSYKLMISALLFILNFRRRALLPPTAFPHPNCGSRNIKVSGIFADNLDQKFSI